MIESDTTWTLAESPYVLTSNVLIMEGATLTIEPGVEIRFAGYYGLAVMGTLNATGSAANPILFTSDSASPSSGDWHSIRSNGDGARIILVHAIVEYPYIGVFDEDGSETDILIDQSIIRHFSQYGIHFSNDDPNCVITNSEIQGSGDNYWGYGIYGQESYWSWDWNDPYFLIRIENNTISETHRGLYLYFDGRINVTVSGNNITGNRYGAEVYGYTRPYNSLFVSGNSIVENEEYGLRLSGGLHDGGYFVVSDNVISSNGRGLELDMWDSHGFVNITQNVITGNDVGIYGVRSEASSCFDIRFNDIFNNTGYDFELAQSGDWNATYNYWGTVNATLIEEHIYDFYDEFTLGTVRYNPAISVSISAQIELDESTVSDGRCDVNSTQKVYFHLKQVRMNRSSAVTSGIIYVNGTGHSVNSTGWVSLEVTSSAVGRETWTVTGVDCGGITEYTQTASNPVIIWDMVEVYQGGVSPSELVVNEAGTVWYQARYGYDGANFVAPQGLLYVNGSTCSWNPLEERWELEVAHQEEAGYVYQVSGIQDTLHGLSVWQTPVGTVMITVLQTRARVLTITVDGSGMTDPSPGVYSHQYGDEIQIDAIPDPTWVLDHWSLDGVDIGSDDPLTLIIRLNQTLTAVFKTDDWPMFHHDLGHSGYSSAAAPIVNTTLWISDESSSIYSSPAVADGVVFVSSRLPAAVYALNESTGIVLWSRSFGGNVESSPAVARGRVFFGCNDRYVYSLNSSTGSTIWSYSTGDDMSSSPAVADGKVFISSYSGKLYALDESTGELLWIHTRDPGEVFLWSSPAVDMGSVYIGSSAAEGGKVLAVNMTTGNLIWSYVTEGTWIYSSPAVAEGRVYVGGYDSMKAYCLDASSGELLWSYDMPGSIWSSPAVIHDRVFIGVFGEPGSSGHVYALNSTTGDLIWMFNATNLVYSSPAVADGKVYAGSGYDYGACEFFALDEESGSLIWKYSLSDSVHSSPAVADGMVFTSIDDGKIICFGSSDEIVIDSSRVSDSRCDVGSVQKVYFHASWSNGSTASDGIIFVDGIGYEMNSSGWVSLVATSSSISMETWTVTGVAINGVTNFTQASPDPTIIWDKIQVYDGGAIPQELEVREVSVIWFKARYMYDSSTLDDAKGVLRVGDSLATWDDLEGRWELSVTQSIEGDYYYSVGSVDDDLYELTGLEDAVGSVQVTFTSEVVVPSRGWSIPLDISARDYSSDVVFGLVEEATYGFDAAVDMIAPPDPPAGILSYFHYPENPSYLQKLTSSYLPVAYPANWTLKVKSVDVTGQASIKWYPWDIEKIPDNYTVTLNTPTGDVNMRETSLYDWVVQSSSEYIFTIDVTFESTEVDVTIVLSPGWNMVSIPVELDDPSADTVLTGISFYQLVSWSGTGYTAATEFEVGQGYWLLVLYETSFTVTGAPLEEVTLNLSPGWTLVGGPNHAITASEVFSGFYQLYTWSGSGYVVASEFEPGIGYWALVLVESEILLE